jgi:antitoxin VapB
VKTTRVFESGNSQAVRIPKEFRFNAATVEISRRRDEVVLRPVTRNLAGAFDLLTALSPDFFRSGRRQPRTQKRSEL